MPTYYGKQLRSGVWVGSIGSNEQPPGPQPFVYGTTVPVLTNPLSPTVNDNVGWDGNSSGGTSYSAGTPATSAQTVTVPSATTWSNRIIHADVILTSSTSVLENCIVYGSASSNGNFARAGIITAANGGTIRRCTVYGQAYSVMYARNAINHSGSSNLLVDRCYFARTVDHIKTSANGNLEVKGCWAGRFAFFNDDEDHSNSSPNPYWTHNDFIQKTGGSGTVTLTGNWMEAYFDTTGVTWSGGSWGVGTASQGSGNIGMPAAALNAGYWSEWGKGTWSNGVTFSRTGTAYNSVITDNWLDGVNASSGIVQWTPDTDNNTTTILRNRFGLGGRPSGSGIIYIVSGRSSDTMTRGVGTADQNTYQNTTNVPASLRGQPLIWTNGYSARIDMDLY